MDGIIIVNKPSGITSYDVIRFLKRNFIFKDKIGHAGTLDPLAEGVLIVCMGRATRLSSSLMGLEKEYIAKMLLGKKTDTDDIDGKIIEEKPVSVNEERIREVFPEFNGEIEQVPPVVSAIKHKGQPLYKLYRKGIPVKPGVRKVLIKEIEILGIKASHVEFRVVCSKGTYIRALCRDIGDRLGCGGVQIELKRTRVGNFTLKHSMTLEDIKKTGIEKSLIKIERL
ncbi:MAG TPA: tRNA pseudouridine(55) synthase TruB [bacterium]|nr:tRNA pseudouridine(55) synthase TruB [bacterium]